MKSSRLRSGDINLLEWLFLLILIIPLINTGIPVAIPTNYALANSDQSDLAVSKTDSPDPVLVGDNLTYTVTVTNNGPDNATEVRVTDILPPGVTFQSAAPSTGSASELAGAVTWDVDNLANGASATLAIVVTPSSSGNITNTATVYGHPPDPKLTNNSASENTTVNEVPPPTDADLAVSKSDSPDPVIVGENLTYTVTVTNHGLADATGVNVTDTLPPGVTYQSANATTGTASNTTGNVTWNVGNLNNGASATLTILVTAPSSSGNITNVVSVSGNENDPKLTNNSDSENTTVNEVPPPTDADLAVSKSDSPDPVIVGENLTYTVNVTNNGLADATGVKVTDNLSAANVTFLSANTATGNYSESAGVVTWNIGNLNNGATANLTIVVAAPSSSGNITNVVSVSGNENDPKLTNNSDSENTTVNEVPPPTDADLAVSKSDSPDPVIVGENLTYTVTVTNNGLADATGVNVTDTLPPGVTYQSANATTGTASNTTGNVTWDVGNLNNGASATLTILVTAPSSSGNITNVVSVSGNENDPKLTNNSASENTTVTPQADLSIAKSDSTDPVISGGNVAPPPFNYVITVTNNGPSDATGVNVTDNLPSGVPFQSANATIGSANETAPGIVSWDVGNLASGTSANLTIVVAPGFIGGNVIFTLNNTANVSGNEYDPDFLNNTATENTTFIGAGLTADLEVTKTDSPEPVLAGENLTYTVNVTNHGLAHATGVNVTDILSVNVTFLSANATTGSTSNSSGIVTWNIGNLNNGATANLTILVTAPATSGNISNNATVSGNEPDPDPSNNSDTENTTVAAHTDADLIITKTDSTDPVPLGGNLTYTVTVTNNGPADATGVNVTDVWQPWLIFQSATPSTGSVNHTADNLTWYVGNLSSGTSANLSLLTTVNRTILLMFTSVNITNTANVVANEPDPVPANNSVSENTTLTTADLAVTKTDSPDPVFFGDNFTYTVNITNNGTDNATGVFVLDLFIKEWLIVHSVTPSTGSVNETIPQWLSDELGYTANTTLGTLDTLYWDVGDLPSSASANLSIVATVNTTTFNTLFPVPLDMLAMFSSFTGFTLPELSIFNMAWAFGDVTDPNPDNNMVTATTNVTLDLPVTDLSINKTDSRDPVFIGDNFTYTVNVTNNGTDNATSVFVLDSLPGFFGFISANQTIPQLLIVQSATPSVGSVNQTMPQLFIDLFTTLGANITQLQALPILWWDVGDLASGASANLSIVAAVNATAFNTLFPIPLDMLGILWSFIGSGTPFEFPIYNSALVLGNVTDSYHNNNYAAESTNVTLDLPVTDLAINKTDSHDPVLAGDNFTYTVTVTNNGTDNATFVNVLDILSENVTFLSANTSAGSANQTMPQWFIDSFAQLGANTTQLQALPIVWWNIGDLPSGASTNLTIFVTANTTAPDILSNVALTFGNVTDTNSANNQAFEYTTIANPTDADLSITKSDSPDPVTVGDNLTYMLTVTNNGPAGATGVNVTDTLPTEVTFQSATPSIGSANHSAGNVTWNIGNLTSGASANLTILVMAPSSPGIITNTANVSGNETDPNLTNSAASENTTVNPGTLEYITISPDSANITAGDNITYTSEAFDQLNNSLGDVTANTTFTIDSAAGGNWTGLFSNTYISEKAGNWTVSGNYTGKSDNATLTVTPGPAVSLDLTPDFGFAVSGISFNVTVTAYDIYANIASSYNGTVNFTSSDPSATLPPDYTFNSTDAGTHIFTNGVTLLTSGNQTVTVTDNINSSLTDNATFTVIVVKPHHILIFPSIITIIAGENVTYTALLFDQASVWLADVTPWTTFSIEVGAGGNWTGSTYTSEKSGNWTVTGNLTLLNMVDTANLTVNPGSLEHIIISPDSANITAGDNVTYTSEAFDQFNNSLGDVTANTTFTIDSAAGGNWTGLFSNTYISEKAGNWTVSGNYTGKSDNATLTVNPGPAVNLDLTPDGGIIISGISFNVNVTAYDGYSNVATSYNGTANFTSSDPSATLPPDYTFNSTDAGTHTFSNGVTLVTTGNQTVTVTDNINSSLTDTANFTVFVPHLVDHLEISPPTATIITGATQTYTAYICDQFNNRGYDVTAWTTFSIDSGAGGNWTGSTYTSEKAGNWTVTSNFTLMSVMNMTDTANLTVNPGLAVSLDLTPDGGIIKAGTSFNVTVTAYDGYSNVATSYNGTANFTSSDPLANLPSDYTFNSTDAGTHIFSSGVTLVATGYQTVTATDTLDSSLTDTTNFTVVTDFYIVISPNTANITAGDNITYTAEAFFTSDNNSLGNITPFTTFSIDSAAGGNWTQNVYTSEKSGNWTVTGTHFIKSDNATLTVTSGPAVSLDLTPDGGTKTSRTPFDVTVTVYDIYANVATSYNGTVTFNSTDSSATLPADYIFTPADAGINTFSSGITLVTTGNQTVTVTDTIVSSLTDNATFTVTRVIPPPPPPDDGDEEVKKKPKEPEAEVKYFTVDFLGKITTVPIAPDGSLLQPLQAPSADGKHLLEIEKGTRALDAEGKIVTLNTITALEIGDPELPGLPHNKTVVGTAYNFEPSGIIFSKPVRLTMSYDVNELPERVESVVLAYYNPESGWIDLEAEGIVLAEVGTITASISHFTIFAIIAEVAPPPAPVILPPAPPAPTVLPPAPPAIFMLSNLSITPSLLKTWEHLTFIKRIGEEATISVEVTNTGGQYGSYTVNLIANGIVLETKEISLEPGQTQKIDFLVSENEPGDYVVQIGSLSGEFQSLVWINWWLITGFAAVFILLCWLTWRYIWKMKKKRERAI